MCKWLKDTKINVQALLRLGLTLALIITISVAIVIHINVSINNIRTEINNIRTEINNIRTEIKVNGDNNTITVLPVNSDKQSSGNFHSFFNANLINLYKFQARWDTNIGFVDGGDRKSYLSLLDIPKETDDPTIKNLAYDAIKNVENSYDGTNIAVMKINIERWNFICRRSAPLPCANGFESPEGYDVDNVFDHLSYGKWQERARAACLLSTMDNPKNTSYKEKKVTKDIVRDKLADLMKEQEPSLFVSKMALETYKVLTPEFSSFGVFDFTEAIKDWEQRKFILKDNSSTDKALPAQI